MLAINSDNNEIIKFLLSRGADIEKSNVVIYLSMIHASVANHCLLQRGETAVEYAIQLQKLEVVEYLQGKILSWPL